MKTKEIGSRGEVPRILLKCCLVFMESCVLFIIVILLITAAADPWFLFTARKRSLGQGNVCTSVCHSVHGGRICIRGGSASRQGLYPGGCVSEGGLHPGLICIHGVFIQWGLHLGGVGQTSDTTGYRQRCAPYWNAFLYWFLFCSINLNGNLENNWPGEGVHSSFAYYPFELPINWTMNWSSDYTNRRPRLHRRRIGIDGSIDESKFPPPAIAQNVLSFMQFFLKL